MERDEISRPIPSVLCFSIMTPAVCHAVTDPFSDHQVGCGGNGDRIHWHDSLRDALYLAAQSAALAPRREVPSLIPGSQSRRADIYLPRWKRGQPAALNVTVISTLQEQTITGASSTQGYALSVGEERKIAAHAEAWGLASGGVNRRLEIHFLLFPLQINLLHSLSITA